MSYDVNTKQEYNAPAPAVSQSASQILESLGGKLSKMNNPAKGQLEATFNKKISGKPLPNRCQVRVKVVPKSAESCAVMTKTFPVDPLGNKLSFGVRGDAAQVVSDTFLEALAASVTG
ncbi:MAG: hypothetical protein D6768_21080 [Chloroflexi bacterium]|nr:MAG: hypothetical protein D6768_21080 [Chloroflexota bacterium]